MESQYWTRFQITSRLSRRRFIAGAGAAGAGIAGLALVGCGSKGAGSSSKSSSSGATSAGTPKTGGTLNLLGAISPPEGLEVAGTRSESADGQAVYLMIYSNLLRFPLGSKYKYADQTLEGELASKWETPDPLTLTFNLKPNVKFHNKAPVNGRTLTSEDVKFSFNRLLNSPFAYVNFFNQIADIQTPDPLTVTFKMKAPDATLMPHMALGYSWITAKEAGKPDPKGALGLSFHDPSSAIGTGPFMLDKYQENTLQTYVRNPDYFESGLPYLDGVNQILVGSDPAPALAALQAGKVDVGTVPPGSVSQLKGTAPKLVYTDTYSPSAWIHGMRVDQTPFTDVRVRRAMSMAYDQAALNKVLETPDAPLTFGSVTANCGAAWLPLDQLGDNAQWWKPDLQAAKQLLSAAGYPNGFETKMTVSNCCENSTLPEVFAADMAKIGIKVNINVQDHPVYTATTVRGQYDGMSGSQFPIWDGDDWFSNLLPGSPRNISHVDDPMVKDLQAKERSELDQQKRLDIMHQLVKYLAGQVYQITHPQAEATVSNQPYVKNYQPRIGQQKILMVSWLAK
jgi:peptide/nickel transport system substrate-binding protein